MGRYLIMKKSCCSENIKGFTLIELLVVVLIIGILAAIALPQYQKAVIKARFAGIETDLKTLARAQDLYYLTNNQYASSMTDLDIQIPSCTCIPGVCTECYYAVSSGGSVSADIESGRRMFKLSVKDSTNCGASNKKGEIIATGEIPSRIKTILGFTQDAGCGELKRP